jgi:C4-dicarboxylate transporter DctM subunit
MPLVIIGSIRYGIATPTEASVIAVVYSLFVGMVVYRTIKWREVPSIVIDAMATTGIVMLMIATATLYGLIITREQIPQEAARMVMALTQDPVLVLLMIVAIYLVAGMLLDLGANIIILVPVLWPLVKTLGIDPVQFGIVTVVALSIGLITPPVGACLFVVCGIARTNIIAASRSVLPFVGALVVVVILIVLFPAIANWLPYSIRR